MIEPPMPSRLPIAVALAASLTTGCREAERLDATVLAAASLSEAFTEIAARYERGHPGTEVALELAASSTLAAQVRAGAPFDVLATADERTMAEVWRAEFVEQPVTFATNRLVVIVPADNPGCRGRACDARGSPPAGRSAARAAAPASRAVPA